MLVCWLTNWSGWHQWVACKHSRLVVNQPILSYPWLPQHLSLLSPQRTWTAAAASHFGSAQQQRWCCPVRYGHDCRLGFVSDLGSRRGEKEAEHAPLALGDSGCLVMLVDHRLEISLKMLFQVIFQDCSGGCSSWPSQNQSLSSGWECIHRMGFLRSQPIIIKLFIYLQRRWSATSLSATLDWLLLQISG